jgi:hypothetical protein
VRRQPLSQDCRDRPYPDDIPGLLGPTRNLCTWVSLSLIVERTTHTAQRETCARYVVFRDVEHQIALAGGRMTSTTLSPSRTPKRTTSAKISATKYQRSRNLCTRAGPSWSGFRFQRRCWFRDFRGFCSSRLIFMRARIITPAYTFTLRKLRNQISSVGSKPTKATKPTPWTILGSFNARSFDDRNCDARADAATSALVGHR